MTVEALLYVFVVIIHCACAQFGGASNLNSQRFEKMVLPDDQGKTYLEFRHLFLQISKCYNYRVLQFRCANSVNCKGIKISSTVATGSVIIFAKGGDVPIIVENGCINNCDCESNGNGNSTICRHGQRKKIDFNSGLVNIAFQPNDAFQSITIKVTGNVSPNSLDMGEIDLTNSQGSSLSDGKVIGVKMPFTKGEKRYYVLTQRLRFSGVAIHVFGVGNNDVEVYAGYGRGQKQFCNSATTCRVPKNPSSSPLYITIKAKVTIDKAVYIKVNGTNLDRFYHDTIDNNP